MSVTIHFAYETLGADAVPDVIFTTPDLNWVLALCDDSHSMSVTQEDLRLVGLTDAFPVEIEWGKWTQPFSPGETLQWAKRWLTLWQKPTNNERIEWMKGQMEFWQEYTVEGLQSLIRLAEQAQSVQKRLILKVT